MTAYRKLAGIASVFSVAAVLLALFSGSMVSRLPAALDGGATYWTYVGLTALLVVVAAFFGAFAYGLKHRLVESADLLGGMSSIRVIKRFAGIQLPGDQRIELSLVASRGSLWLLRSTGTDTAE